MITDVDLALPDKAWLLEKRCLIRSGYLVGVGVKLCLIRPNCLVGISETLPEKAWLASV